jgi:hypothetical protein
MGYYMDEIMLPGEEFFHAAKPNRIEYLSFKGSLTKHVEWKHISIESSGVNFARCKVFRISSRRLFALDEQGNAGIVRYGHGSLDKGEITMVPNSGHKRLCYGNFLLKDFMVFIIGGQSMTGTPNLTCQYFDLTQMVWNNIANLNSKKTFFPAVFPSLDSKFLFAAEGHYAKNMERYSFEKDMWQLLNVKPPKHQMLPFCLWQFSTKLGGISPNSVLLFGNEANNTFLFDMDKLAFMQSPHFCQYDKFSRG